MEQIIEDRLRVAVVVFVVVVAELLAANKETEGFSAPH